MQPLRGWTVLAILAFAAIAAWPLVNRSARAAQVYVAPVQRDDLLRDSTVAFYERRVQRDPRDQLSAVLLAGQYMQRYRESGDVDDITRALGQARRALRLQPQNNAAADETIASAYTALHRFHDALAYERAAQREQPADSNAAAQAASLEMEIGRYAQAARDLQRAERLRFTPTVMSVQARYDEVTGNLAGAETLLQRAMQLDDGNYDNGAQGRAWYHFRLGEVLFEEGKTAQAQAREREAVAIFPNLELAYRALARICYYGRDWNCALEAGSKGSAIVPVPETLGYKADAQDALGDHAAAAQTRALIYALQRIGNAYHLNDRLLAVYYADHRTRLQDAYRIAQREVAARGQEIYAQDTLAWTAALNGKWEIARRAIAAAERTGIQDPRVARHAAFIAALGKEPVPTTPTQ